MHLVNLAFKKFIILIKLELITFMLFKLMKQRFIMFKAKIMLKFMMFKVMMFKVMMFKVMMFKVMMFKVMMFKFKILK